jgi:hypothetical protein
MSGGGSSIGSGRTREGSRDPVRRLVFGVLRLFDHAFWSCNIYCRDRRHQLGPSHPWPSDFLGLTRVTGMGGALPHRSLGYSS